jgi:Icc protein
VANTSDRTNKTRGSERERAHRDDAQEDLGRRGFLKCMAWAGTGAVWTLQNGILRGAPLEEILPAPGASDFQFVQISDSHIGFAKEANNNVIGTLQEAVAKIKAQPHAPAFLLHTGDLTHFSKPEEFDTLDQILRGVSADVFRVPGEHDVLNDNGAQFLQRYGAKTTGAGWHSFDYRGVHFIGLVNVVDLKAGGLGTLGDAQLQWLERDVAPLGTSTPIVVFAHIPLWSVYPDWGWGTDDSERALGYLKRFGSVTVLNGHIHQVMQKLEGGVTFHTAMSTAFPQPAPGSAPSPGPMKVEAGRLRTLLGLTNISFEATARRLAIADTPLLKGSASPAAGGHDVRIDNFSFAPTELTVAPGTRVIWTNHDDIPHTVVGTEKQFASPVLDTDDRFTWEFTKPGTYRYYCSIHPKMTGTVVISANETSQ